MLEPETKIATQNGYTAMYDILTGLTKTLFFFKSSQYCTKEILCPIYMTDEFQKKHSQALHDVVIMAHSTTTGNTFAILSELSNKRNYERAEYLVYRLLEEIEEQVI